jgi:epoxyqueuosine reductase
VLSGAAVRAAALDCRFTLVGLARAQPLDPAPLERWLAAGYAADMDWMARRMPERLDPTRVLAGAATVIALAIAYRRPPGERARSVVAGYARGRDYHYTHRDRMKALRQRLLALDPGLETYACVDTGLAMEKAWAERAGLGWIGKNGCLIHPALGSSLTLSVMFVDRVVDGYDLPHANRCGDCALCLRACPTQAFPAPGVVDARRCVAYQSIENRGQVPIALRRGFRGRVFGCDVCQDVCPYNRVGEHKNRGEKSSPPPATSRPARYRPLEPWKAETIESLATLDEARFRALTSGSPVRRATWAGLARNAVTVLANRRDPRYKDLFQRLAREHPDAAVREHAGWALSLLEPPCAG